MALKTRGFEVVRIAAPLRHSVAESIRNAIAIGHFHAGQRLPERYLCEITRVSRTLVREALRQLESEGLIVVLPNRGPFVAALTVEQTEGIYQVRRELEGLASELFAKVAGEEARSALRDAFQSLKASFRKSDPIARLNAKNRFYDCLVEGSGNEALGNSLRMLNSRVMVLRATSLQAPDRLRRSIAELSQLMNALMARDSNAARALAVRHVDNAAAAALQFLRERDGHAEKLTATSFAKPSRY